VHAAEDIGPMLDLAVFPAPPGEQSAAYEINEASLKIGSAQVQGHGRQERGRSRQEIDQLMPVRQGVYDRNPLKTGCPEASGYFSQPGKGYIRPPAVKPWDKTSDQPVQIRGIVLQAGCCGLHLQELDKGVAAIHFSLFCKRESRSIAFSATFLISEDPFFSKAV
jgi:hypothetical protein